MSTLARLAILSLLCASLAAGQIVSATVDLLDGADPGAPTPSGVLVLDFRVDVASTDTWASGGIRCVTDNGATLIYGDNDFNTPGVDLINTGSINNRFVTVLSIPRGRNAAARFDNGAVAISGSHDPPSSVPIIGPTELNVSFYADPPPDSASPSVDGYVIRIALSAPGSSAWSGIEITTVPHPSPGFGILLATITGFDDGSPAAGWVNGTLDAGTQTGGSFWVWDIPEPSSLALMLIAAASSLRRMRR